MLSINTQYCSSRLLSHDPAELDFDNVHRKEVFCKNNFCTHCTDNGTKSEMDSFIKQSIMPQMGRRYVSPPYLRAYKLDCTLCHSLRVLIIVSAHSCSSFRWSAVDNMDAMR